MKYNLNEKFQIETKSVLIENYPTAELVKIVTKDKRTNDLFVGHREFKELLVLIKEIELNNDK